jgi:exopolysaccharide biosynthesis polyprenyl glycosylphosphotransferase
VPVAARLRRVVAAIFLTDLVVLGVTFAIAFYTRASFSTADDPFVSPLTPWVFVLWLACLVGAATYDQRVLGGGTEEFRRVAAASLVAFGLLGTVAYFTKSPLSRGFVVISFVLGTVLLLSCRYALRKFLHRLRLRGHLHARVIAVCSPDALVEVVSTFTRTAWAGYTVVGACVPDRHVGDVPNQPPVPILGGSNDIVAACRETGADTVLVAGGGHHSSMALRRIAWALEGTEIELVVEPGLIDVAGPRIHMRQVGGLPLVHVDKPQVGRAGGFTKRGFDLVVCSAMLLVLALPMALIALAIKLQDRGPVFYRQERSGRDGELFPMLKFRSMVVDADQRLDDLMALNEVDGVLFKMKEDPRVTRLGRFLRKYSLDELPQLFNVMRGQMSLVGPRPPLPKEVLDYPVDMHRRLLVRPGLTGLWQVSGRSDLPFEEAVRMDLYYVDNWSIIGDVIILLKTVRAVATSHGAY